MARLENYARAGYWPTPDRVTAAITRFLVPGQGGTRRTIRILDPCAGTGKAVAAIAATLGAESYGVELNAGRANEARGVLTRVLSNDAFAIRLTNGGFSGMLLNPPYADDQEQRRVEHAFVQSMTRALCAGGVLVYIIPQRRLEVSARFLASHYASLAAYRFPDPEFAAFRQIVVFGAKKPHAKNDPAMVHRLAEWGANEHLEPLPDAPGPWDPLYRLPAVPRAPLLFAGLIFDPVEAAAEARRAGAWAAQPLTERLWPAQARATKPLLPLRRGHLAQLIAAGFLNNVVLRHGGRRVLVKGRVRKELVTIVADDEQTIEREYLRTSLTMLDLDSGEIERIHSGTAPAGEDDASRRAA